MSLTVLLSQLEQLSAQLEALLDQEFEYLKASNIEAFEVLQSEKAQVLAALGSPATIEAINSLQSDSTIIAQHGAEANALWGTITDALARSKDKHQRNEIVITRKLDTVRAALDTIKSPNLQNTVDTYDRLGRLGNRGGKSSLGKV
ncbi:MAG: flagellar export chaperone FlgN [Halieaceae bacterium]|nr:flagellar export chaperone FlgN [Halieaceae bacterium]